MEGIQVTFNFKEGATPSDIASKLRFHAGLLEGMTGKDAASRANTDAPKKAVKTAPIDEDVDTTSDDDEDDDFQPKKTVVTKNSATKKASASFDDDEDEVDPPDEDEEEEVPAKKAPAKKAKKVTLDDVNDACKARAAQTGGKEGRAEVLGILKKKFKTTSVSDLDADQYPAVIAAMQA